MKILGIDPGTIKVGYGVIDVSTTKKLQLVAAGTITPCSKDVPYKRLGFILQKIEEIIINFKPDVIALEKSFFGKNVKSLISLGEARGIVLALAGKYNTEFAEFSPLSIKQSVVGSGSADKERVQKMVKMILNINSDIKYFDESDALAIALCCHYRNKGKTPL